MNDEFTAEEMEENLENALDCEFDAAWEQEMAMEAGMLHGIDAYNEEMGFNLEPPRCDDPDCDDPDCDGRE
jgi:hypothetical protein